MAGKAAGAGTRGGARRPASASWLKLAYPGLSRPVIVADAAELVDGLLRCQSGCVPQISGFDPAGEPEAAAEALCVVEDRGGGLFSVHSRFLDTPLDRLPATSAVCSVIADLVQAYCEETEGALGLHCGAIRIGGRLVVLTGRRRAGKSTLVSRLAAEPGVEVFCDDVLTVLADGTAIGLGFAPRLRLPLPKDATPGFRAHVDACLGPRDDRYGYLLTPTLAPHGTRAPLSAIVALDRREGVPARLHALDPGDVVNMLLFQTITDLPSAEHAFEAARALTAELPALTLVYSDLEDAVDLLRNAFAGSEKLAASLDIGPSLPAAPPERYALVSTPPDQVWRRCEGVATRRHGQAAFLWLPGDQMLWQLNTVAMAVWELLEVPGNVDELADALAEVFTDTPRERLIADICELIAALACEGLVAPHSAASAWGATARSKT